MELNGASSPGAPAAWANAFCISTSGYLALEGPANALTKQRHSYSSSISSKHHPWRVQLGSAAPAAGWISRKFSGDLRPVFHLPSPSQVAFLPARFCTFPSGCTMTPCWSTRMSRVGVRAAVPVWELTKARSLTCQVILGSYWAHILHVEHTKLHL